MRTMMNFFIKEIKHKEKKFPKLLREISNIPKKLYFKGQLPRNSEPAVAIVGTRKATLQGLEAARIISKGLAEVGIVVVSGLALGIDGAAHQGALSGKGKTIAVLAGGLDSVYPKEHRELAHEILELNGGILSEYEPGISSLPQHFLERNRIISGLTLGVVVIEAPLRSGALSTAHYALEQGREVFVVPGPINHSNYFGAHKLIRNGARLITSAKEIIEDLERQLDEYRFNKLPLPHGK